MPYLLLVIGVIIGVYALMKFFMRANPSQIKAFMLAVFTASVAIALFVLAITGRLPVAIAGLGALIPFIINIVRSRKKAAQGSGASGSDAMDHDEALEVLNLKDGASDEEIKVAYKNLMKKVHPDQDGSEWMAQKLNQAKTLLLKGKR